MALSIRELFLKFYLVSSDIVKSYSRANFSVRKNYFFCFFTR